MSLENPPNFPIGVKRALSVPSSVLFTDLSMRGNLRCAFMEAMQIDYELPFVIHDNTAISWNYDSDSVFCAALCGQRGVIDGIRLFIETMERTARTLDRCSRIASSNKIRRHGVVADLIEDLEEYWTAFKQHMTSLFVFWNVEALLSSELIARLGKLGHTEYLQHGLGPLLQASETNYFVLERRLLQKLVRRFVQSNSDLCLADINIDTTPQSLLNALQFHRDTFEFLFAPFNIGSPPSIESMIDRIREYGNDPAVAGVSGFSRTFDLFDQLPSDVRELGNLARRLGFWKTERLDVAFLSDFRLMGLYREVAAYLDIPAVHVQTLTSEEIIKSLWQGEPAIDSAIRCDRMISYCLAMQNGKISFYEPSAQSTNPIPKQPANTGTIFRGLGVSPGEITARARVIPSLEDITSVESGEILLSTMTRPEMGVALDRAGGFVTDEGGLLCHAAIIAREMGKPCVVSVNDASLRIKTGMILKVDGTKGEVTVLSK